MKHEVAQVVRKLEGIGWSLDGLAGSGHYRMTHPGGGVVMVPATPSDGRWKANLIAEAERACGEKIERPSAARYSGKQGSVSTLHRSRSEREASARLDRAERKLRAHLKRFALILSQATPNNRRTASELMWIATHCEELHAELTEGFRPVAPLPPLVVDAADAYFLKMTGIDRAQRRTG